MTRDRLLELIGIAQKAVARLDEAVGLPESSITQDATIQRFEFSWETLWKCLQGYAQYQGLDGSGPRQAIKNAFACGLMQTANDVDVWYEMLDDRNRTTRLYDENTAAEIYQRIRSSYRESMLRMADRLSGSDLSVKCSLVRRS